MADIFIHKEPIKHEDAPGEYTDNYYDLYTQTFRQEN